MRYKKMADYLVEDIRQGKVQPGQKLPSLRQLARVNEVSLTTALNCYRYLEETGWIQALPQSGFYVRKPLDVSGSPEMPAFSCQTTTPIADHFFHSEEPGPLGITQLSVELQPVSKLERSLRRASRSQGSRVCLYPNVQGELPLRRSLSEHFGASGFHFQASDLVITNGCLDAVRTALEVTTKPGDAVAVSSPCYSGLLQLLGGMGRTVVEIPSTMDGLDLRQMELQMQKGGVRAGLFTSSHMNPTGISLSVEQKQQLAGLANKYRIPIIEDDVYHELDHRGAPPLPAYHWDTGGYLLWCGSISKTLSAGYRLGWCLPGRYLNNYRQQRQLESLGVNSPLQLSLADFISSGQYAKHLATLRPLLREQVDQYRNFLADHLIPKVRISMPTGGLVLWLQVPGLNEDEFAILLKRQLLDIRTGVCFSTLNYYKDCLRINCGFPLRDNNGEYSQAKKQLEQLVELINRSVAA
ncbi:aminotransferase-like domain-containing protein [Microbulbifer sp. PSTR4-B]|uniref:aminotransferase-like domain-containing protein n=1 Tax=Microbulbifer sp. PSTR4-B TaxID=3243396 RepID=UPI00403977D6